MKVIKSGLIVAAVDVDVTHNTRESLKSTVFKNFRQGRGKRIIDLKFGSAPATEAGVLSKESFPLVYRLIFNYSYWCGYYAYSHSYGKFIIHVLKDFFKYLNYLRFSLLKKISD